MQRQHASSLPALRQPTRNDPRARPRWRAAAAPSASYNQGISEASWMLRRPREAQPRRGCEGGRRAHCGVAPRTWSALASTCSNSTTRPPRSPVASCAPVASNSTAEMMSAAGRARAWASVHRAAVRVAPRRRVKHPSSAPHCSPNARNGVRCPAQPRARRRRRRLVSARAGPRRPAAADRRLVPARRGPIRAGVVRA